MLKTLTKNKFIPYLYILIIWGIFAFPYIFQNKIPYPSDYQVNKFIPWSMDEALAGPVKSESMPDVIGQIYPWRYFTISQWKKGEIPLWNPNSFSGTPHLANYQSAVFSPFNIMFLILPFIEAWSINILLQPLIAGIGTYLFLRTKKLDKIPCLIGTTTFMFSGFMVVWIAYGTLALAASFLPLVLFALEKILQTKEKKFTLLLMLSLATSFLVGHFQTSVYVLLFTSLYISFKFLTEKINTKVILIIGISILLSLLIALLQIIPTILYYNQAVRQTLTVTSGGIPFTYLITLIAPDFFGHPVTRNNWFGLYAEWASFIGVIPLTMSLFSIYSKKKVDAIFFSFTSILFLLLALDGPLQHILISTGLPIFSTSMPSRIIFLASFSLSVLSGFGAQNLKELLAKEKFRRIIPILLAVNTTIVLIMAIVLIFKLIPPEYQNISIKNLILPLILISLFLMSIITSFFIQRIRTYLLLIALILLSIDSLRFAIKWMPFSEKENVYSDTKVLQKLQSLDSNARVAGNYAAYIDTYYQIPSLEGFDSLYIKRYGEFLEAAVDGKYHIPQRNTVHLARNGEYTNRVLSLLGVTYFFHVRNDTGKSWAYPVWSDKNTYQKIYEDKDFQIYKYLNSQSRAKIFYNFEVLTSDKKLLSRFYSPEFDYENALLLESDPDLKSLEKNPKGKVEIIMNSPNKVVLKVSSNSKGLLFLADPYYPNWKAIVNGKEEKIYRADYAFRTVKVPAGESEVVFTYDFL